MAVLPHHHRNTDTDQLPPAAATELGQQWLVPVHFLYLPTAYCLVKKNHSGVETKFVVYFVFLLHQNSRISNHKVSWAWGPRFLNTLL